MSRATVVSSTRFLGVTAWATTTDESKLLSARRPPPDMLVQLEQQHLVRQALRRLGGRCEQLLVALYTNQGGPGYEEVAAKLDMPQGSIGPARARCLHKLLEIMDSMDRDDDRPARIS